MFTFLRSKKKSITNILLVGFLALMMMGWGADMFSSRQSGNLSDAAIKVNGDKITYAQFNEQLQNIRQMYKQRFGAAFDQIAASINLEQQAVDATIDEKLGESFIDSMNIVVSKQQVQGKIFSMPFFQKAGLSQQTYRQFLQAINMTGDQLEAIMQKEIANEMIANVLADVTTPTPTEFKAWMNGQNTKFDFTYAEIPAESFTQASLPKDDTELSSFYEQTKEAYRKPKSVRYSYVKFKPADYASKVAIEEEDVQELYHTKKVTFGDKSLAEVRPQLEAELRANDAPQYAHVEAQNFFDRYLDAKNKDSKSFADYAKEKGMTVLSSATLLAPHETPNGDKEAEGLTAKLGNISTGEPTLLELPAADFVVVVDETKDAYVPPLNEVRPAVVASFNSKRSKDLAKESAEKLLAAVKLEQPTAMKDKLVANARTFKGEVKTEKGVSKGDDSGATPIFAAASTKQVVLGLTPQNPLAPRVFEMADKYYVIVYTNSTPATEEDLKKVYAEFKETERNERLGRMMGEIKRALRKDAEIWVDKDILEKAAG